MPEFLQRLFSADGFMPHGHCYLWRPEIVWLHVISDGLVALSYTTIPFTLYSFARRRKDLPFNWMFLCFAVFIIACGATHYMEIVTLWDPMYRLSGVIKAITAAASVPTAILLVRLVPQALAIPSPHELAKAHEELRTAHAALEARNGELHRSEADLRAANRELEAFSYSVAHDLRAPLRAINGFARVLLEDYGDKLEAEALESLGKIRSNAIQMADLIDALLSLARVSRSEARAEPVDLSALARAAAARLAAADPAANVDVVVQNGLVEPMDPVLARTLLDNLLGNAWKFTKASPSPRVEFGVTLTARGEGGPDEKTFFVRDNGAGFDMAHGARLFVAFQRLHSARDYPGTGIGLATSRRIVERHGGRIWAEGRVEQGATFYFTLGALRVERSSSRPKAATSSPIEAYTHSAPASSSSSRDP
jgi:signal transduction histidine kinase